MKLIKIGSSSACDIVINSKYVSAHHADLTLLDNGDIILEDKDSTNGTFVGNKKVEAGQEIPVRRGDLIRFGDEALVWARVPSLDNNRKYKTIVNIGTNYRNDIVINSGAVSRYHACLKIAKDGKAFLIDNGSKNGTQINGVKIVSGKPERIKRGDNIICGGEDITEQLQQYLPPTIPTWGWATIGVVAAAVIGLLCYFFIPIDGGHKIDPQEYRNAVVYVRAAYHYEVTLKDNPLSESNKGLLEKETDAIPYQATAFFIDEEGRMATNRHVALPWDEEYRSKEITEQLHQGYQKFIANQLQVESLDYFSVTSMVTALKRLQGTTLGKILLDESNSWEDLKAKIDRIKKSEVVISGEIDYITVGYPGQNYTHEDEFQRCFVLCESGNKDIDLAILQLNDKKTPQDIKRLFNPAHFFLEEVEPAGELLFVYGYPNGLSWGMNEKTKSLEPNIIETKCSKAQDKYDFEFQANSIGGSSGSPIFNTKGQLVGILHGGYRGTTVTYAVLAKYLKKLYDEEVNP